MPKYDGSGPMGQGAMTGRKMGQCIGDRVMSEGHRGARRQGRKAKMMQGRRLRHTDESQEVSKESLLIRREMLLNRKEILQLKLEEVNSQLASL